LGEELGVLMHLGARLARDRGRAVLRRRVEDGDLAEAGAQEPVDDRRNRPRTLARGDDHGNSADFEVCELAVVEGPGHELTIVAGRWRRPVPERPGPTCSTKVAPTSAWSGPPATEP